MYGDGGGKALAVPRPVNGREAVARLLLGLGNLVQPLALTWRHAEINGQPGRVFLDREGKLAFIVSVDIADDQVQTVNAVSNPEKLRHLGPVSDVVVRARRES